MRTIHSGATAMLMMPLALLFVLMEAARAQDENSPAPVMEKHGLLGTWAYDCGRRASEKNVYYVYRALDEQRVQFDMMADPTKGREAGLIESAVEVGRHDVKITRTTRVQNREMHDVMTFHVEGNRRRTTEWTQNGIAQVAGGRYTNTKDNGQFAGQTPNWQYRCD